LIALEVDLRDVGLDQRFALAGAAVPEDVSQVAPELVNRLLTGLAGRGREGCPGPKLCCWR
jgi:hypothetical protein